MRLCTVQNVGAELFFKEKSFGRTKRNVDLLGRQEIVMVRIVKEGSVLYVFAGYFL